MVICMLSCMRSARTAAILSMLALVAAAGCSKTEVTESVVRNAAAVAGTAQFEASGYPLQDLLACQTAGAADIITVTCIGTTKNGQPVAMTGDVTTDGSNADKVAGAVVGTVDGAEVFRKDCIGDC
jgi:hypothetical protein